MRRILIYCAISAIALSFSLGDSIAQGRAKREGDGYRLIAHRGGVIDSVTAENSLGALRKAAEAGFWMVEIDLRLTKDSVLIIHHDRDFKRYYGVPTLVGEMLWKDISKLVGDKGNTVLKFEDALRFCQQNGLELMVDNKIRGNDRTLFSKVVHLLRQYGLDDNALMIGTRESTDFFTGKIKLSCTRQQLEDTMKRPDYDSDHYYLFSGDITKEDFQWASENNILVVGVINTWGIKSADIMDEARLRAAKLKAVGVRYFQIDSVYDVFFK